MAEAEENTAVQHAVNVLQALQPIRGVADEAHLNRRAALQLAEMQLTAAIKNGGKNLKEALGQAASSAGALLNKDSPAAVYPLIADLFEAMVPALRELGETDVADELASAAPVIRGVPS